MDLFAFIPDVARTRHVDLAIRQALVDSVTTVLDHAARLGIAFDGDVAAWGRHLLASPGAPPSLWACYHDLVQAVLRADAAAVGAVASDLMARLPARPTAPGSVLTIDESDLGGVDALRYRVVIDNDPQRPLDLRAVAPTEVARVTALADDARALLGDVAPALHDEIDTLAHQIVLATGVARNFGGAASVFLWGAVVLNPNLVRDRVTMVESLAHESAHALLFGLTLGADLTTNDPDERYRSPLRPDPRPIEGIVHATYVLARMNHALGELRSSPSLTASEQALIATKRARNAENYKSGLSIVEAHARFTEDGAAIFAACRHAVADQTIVSAA